MAMLQRDNFIDQIQRLEGLMAYAEEHHDAAETDKKTTEKTNKKIRGKGGHWEVV